MNEPFDKLSGERASPIAGSERVCFAPVRAEAGQSTRPVRSVGGAQSPGIKLQWRKRPDMAEQHYENVKIEREQGVGFPLFQPAGEAEMP